MLGAANLPLESVIIELIDETPDGSGILDKSEPFFLAATGGAPAVVREDGLEERLWANPSV